MTLRVGRIPGALAGIGRATALAFARRGARRVVSGRSDDAGAMLVGEVRALGVEAEFIRADVRQWTDVEARVAGALARFGHLDVAVNNAGTEGLSGPPTEQTAQNYAAVFDTNVPGTLLNLKYELRAMRRHGSGSIVNLSSTLGHRGAPDASLYVASKHAVESLTKSAALEGVGAGIRINAIAPGPVDTDMSTRLTGNDERKNALVAGVPMQHMRTPDEIAQAVVWLASDQASFLTGQVIDVNGGKTAF